MNRKELLGRALFCSWARAPKRGEALAGGGGASASAGDRGAGTASGSAPAPAAVRPRPPPGAGAAASLPTLPAVKLPPEVAAMAAARKQRLMEGSGGGAPAGGPAPSSTLLRPPRGTLGSVPRPAGAASYPSTDPQRLGSKAAAPSDE
jgi:hypothetical protein